MVLNTNPWNNEINLISSNVSPLYFWDIQLTSNPNNIEQEDDKPSAIYNSPNISWNWIPVKDNRNQDSDFSFWILSFAISHDDLLLLFWENCIFHVTFHVSKWKD